MPASVATSEDITVFKRQLQNINLRANLRYPSFHFIRVQTMIRLRVGCLQLLCIAGEACLLQC